MRNGLGVTMHCPKCNDKKLKVIDSRDRELHANSLIRRRECTACGHRFNTKEVVISVAYKSESRATTGAKASLTKKATVQKQKIQKEKELELDIASILDSI